jgi:hypothetical protein
MIVFSGQIVKLISAGLALAPKGTSRPATFPCLEPLSCKRYYGARY